MGVHTRHGLLDRSCRAHEIALGANQNERLGHEALLVSKKRLGPYEILAFLKAGGMGEVYRARDTRLLRTVAVKVLPAAADPEHYRRFEHEARAISRLSHPRICALYDVGQHDGVSFLVMEYLEGESLAERMSKGALPLQGALRHTTEIAEALAEAHRQGIVHRDLKPANVVLTSRGAKLLDFGTQSWAQAPSRKRPRQPRRRS